jgi:phenylacetate-coenzyme A ligase PaaK-like adenylate-forming protein
MAKHELTIKLPDDVLDEIERYKKSAHKKSTEEAVTELIKHALAMPPYFRDFDWEKAESEADEEIAAGKIKSFDSVEDFLADLKK